MCPLSTYRGKTPCSATRVSVGLHEATLRVSSAGRHGLLRPGVGRHDQRRERHPGHRCRTPPVDPAADSSQEDQHVRSGKGSGKGSQSIAQEAVRYAEGKIGAPYRWGAAGPDAFDCSGLVQWSYRQVGVTLKRTTYDQATQGKPVSRSQLRPGDLVFFTPGRAMSPSMSATTRSSTRPEAARPSRSSPCPATTRRTSTPRAGSSKPPRKTPVTPASERCRVARNSGSSTGTPHRCPPRAARQGHKALMLRAAVRRVVVR